MKRFLPILVICMGFCFVSESLAQAASNSGLAANPVYGKNCAKCHGKTADGRHFGGPSLKTKSVQDTSDGDLREIIANGKGHMPKFGDKLSPDEISTLIEQIKALK